MVVGARIDARVMGMRLIRLDARIEVVPAEPLPSEVLPPQSPGPAAPLGPVARHDPVTVGSQLALAGSLLTEAEDMLQDARQVHVQLTRIAGGQPVSD